MTNLTIPALCIVRIIARQEMFLYSTTPEARRWTRHPARAQKFDSWTAAKKAAVQILGAQVGIADVPIQLGRPDRVERLEAIARVAADLHFEAIQHDATTFRVSRRALLALEDALAMYHAEEPR